MRTSIMIWLRDKKSLTGIDLQLPILAHPFLMFGHTFAPLTPFHPYGGVCRSIEIKKTHYKVVICLIFFEKFISPHKTGECAGMMVQQMSVCAWCVSLMCVIMCLLVCV